MADEVRLIDANSVCKKIVESIRCAEKWANEAKEQQDTHGLRCATEAKTSLLAMLTRIHDEPTIKAKPVNDWISVKDRLPDKDGKYLVCGDIHLWDIEKYRANECVVIARFTERNEWLTSLSVKYWMFLPELPSEDDTE